MNPTGKDDWISRPTARSAHRTLVPLVANSAWSQALGPDASCLDDAEARTSSISRTQPPPDVWLVYRTNPAISFWDTKAVGETMAKFPFTVCFALTRDETNHVADVLLARLHRPRRPAVDAHRRHEIYRAVLGSSGLRPARIRRCRRRARRATSPGSRPSLRAVPACSSEYNAAINRGAADVKLKGKNYDFSLDVTKAHSVEEIWDASCRAASAELTDGAETQGLDWFRANGFRVKPFPRLMWYLYPKLVEEGLRFEQPYQERLLRVGKELERRLHEQGITWWDKQLAEYEALPHWHDLSGLWEDALAKHFKVQHRRLSVLARHLAQHAIFLGQQCRRAVDQGSRRQRRGPRQRGDERKRGGKARHRRRRPGRGALAAQQHQRQGDVARGHPPRHAC